MHSRPTKNAITQAVERAYAVLPAEEAASHRWLANTYITVIDALVNHIGDLAGKQIIDVGAGRGVTALALKFLGADVTACERFVFENERTDMFHSAQANGIMDAWTSNGIHPLVGDVYELERLCGDKTFDAAVSIQVIEHLPSPKRMIDGINRILKPGGTLVLSAPNYGRLQARLRLLIGRNPKVDLEDFYLRGVDGFVGHWREYLPAELTQMLTWSGFKEVHSSTFCDVWYPWKKRPSVSSAKDALLSLLSKLIPGAQYELLSVSIKQ